MGPLVKFAILDLFPITTQMCPLFTRNMWLLEFLANIMIKTGNRSKHTRVIPFLYSQAHKMLKKGGQQKKDGQQD